MTGSTATAYTCRPQRVQHVNLQIFHATITQFWPHFTSDRISYQYALFLLNPNSLYFFTQIIFLGHHTQSLFDCPEVPFEMFGLDVYTCMPHWATLRLGPSCSYTRTTIDMYQSLPQWGPLISFNDYLIKWENEDCPCNTTEVWTLIALKCQWKSKKKIEFITWMLISAMKVKTAMKTSCFSEKLYV